MMPWVYGTWVDSVYPTQMSLVGIPSFVTGGFESAPTTGLCYVPIWTYIYSQVETGHRNPAKLECCSRSWRPVDPPSAKLLRQNAQVIGLAPELIKNGEHRPRLSRTAASQR